MKLRNKKTGKIQTCDMVVITDEPIDGEIARLNRHTFLFRSIEQFNDEYEAYKPTEPLIKDEKICKAVRAWADAFNVDVAYLAPIGDGSKFVELFNEDSDGFERIAIPAENIKQEQCYTIAELCGEATDEA